MSETAGGSMRDRMLELIRKEKSARTIRLMDALGIDGKAVKLLGAALATSGLIKVWNINPRAAIYALPEVADPRRPRGKAPEKGIPATVAAPKASPRASAAPKAAATPPYKPRAKSEKPKLEQARTSPSGEAPALKSLFEVDLRFVGILQERTGRLMGAIASENPIDGELLDLFCLTTDWLRERRATA